MRTLLCVVGLCLGLTTSAQVTVWGDEVLLWQQATRVSPAKPRPWVNLGVALHRVGETARAREAYRQAVRVAADRPAWEARVTRGVSLMNLGLTETDPQTRAVWMAHARRERIREVEERWLAQP